jgi:hypothetical protein
MAFVNVNPFQLYKIAIANGDADTTLDMSAIGISYDIEYLPPLPASFGLLHSRMTTVLII